MSSTNYAVFFIVLILMQHSGCYADSKDNNKPGIWDKVKETVEVASENGMLALGLKTAAVAGVTIAATPLVLTAAGFGAAGVAAGSTAAAIQATWFGGAITGMTGAAFGALQSAGVAGLGVGAKAAIVAGSGAIVKVYDYATGKEEEEKPPDNSWSTWVKNYVNGDG